MGAVPVQAVKGVRQVQLHPSVARPLRCHRLHRVEEGFGAGRPSGAELVFPRGLEQGVLVLPHQRPGGEFAEALPARHRPHSAVVLEERRELREA